MSLALDGHAFAGTQNLNSVAANLTTALTNNVIVALVNIKDNSSNSVSGTVTSPHLTWTLRARHRMTDAFGSFICAEIWYAMAAGTLTAETITAAISGSPDGRQNIVVFGVNGADQTTPFDPNVSLPDFADYSSSSNTFTHHVNGVTTDNPDCFLIGALFANNSTGTANSTGWTNIEANNNGGSCATLVEYKIVSANQASATVDVWNQNNTSLFVAFVDAIQGPGVAPGPTLALDGSAVTASADSQTGNTITLSTSLTDDVVVLLLSNHAFGLAAVKASSITDTSGLTWHKRVQNAAFDGIGSAFIDYEIWWAHAPGVLTSDIITVSWDAAPDAGTIVAFAVNGANFHSPFDTNASLPTQASGGSNAPSVPGVTTDTPDAIMIAFAADDQTSAPATPSGYTSLATATHSVSSIFNAVRASYKINTVLEYEATVAASGSRNFWAMVVDAIVPAGSGLDSLPGLDDTDITNVYAAYALRQLRSEYTGPLVRLYSVTTTVEQDFYAGSDGLLDIDAVAAWRTSQGAESGPILVSTWYNQIGSGPDLDGLHNTVSNGPIIAQASGSLQAFPNGALGILFDGNREFETVSITGPGAVSFIVAMLRDQSSPGTVFNFDKADAALLDAGFMIADSASQDWSDNALVLFGHGHNSGRSPRVVANISAPETDTDGQIYDGELTALRSAIRKNGAAVSTAVSVHSSYTAIGTADLHVGPRDFTTNKLTLIGELVFFNVDMHSALDDYRSNMAAHFRTGSIATVGASDLDVTLLDEAALTATIVVLVTFALNVTLVDDAIITAVPSLVDVSDMHCTLIDDAVIVCGLTTVIIERPPNSQLMVICVSV